MSAAYVAVIRAADRMAAVARPGTCVLRWIANIGAVSPFAWPNISSRARTVKPFGGDGRDLSHPCIPSYPVAYEIRQRSNKRDIDLISDELKKGAKRLTQESLGSH